MPSNLARIKTLTKNHGKDWKDIKVVEQAITRYMDGGDYVSNGYWMTPKKFEPRYFRAINKNEKNSQMEKLWRRAIEAPKHEMQLRGAKFEHGGEIFWEYIYDTQGQSPMLKKGEEPPKPQFLQSWNQNEAEGRAELLLRLRKKKLI